MAILATRISSSTRVSQFVSRELESSRLVVGKGEREGEKQRDRERRKLFSNS